MGVLFDTKLYFKEHLDKKLNKANSILAVIKKYIFDILFYPKKVVHTHITVVWMFHSKELNNKINKVDGKAVRILYNHDESTFE